MNALSHLKFGIRLLKKNPGFTAVAVFTLAIGIGANASIFSVVNGLLFSSLPYEESDRLLVFYESNVERGWSDVSIAPGNFESWRSQSRSFEEMALYDTQSFNLTQAGEPVRVGGLYTHANLFSVLGRTPLAGRVFSESELQQNEKVAVLSHGLWLRRFGGEPDAVGKPIRLDGTPHTVVGIMPEDFVFPYKTTDVWVPINLTPEEAQSRSNRSYKGIGRLASGVSADEATSELSIIARRLAEEFPDSNKGWLTAPKTMKEDLFDSEDRLIITTIYLSVGFVVLICCVNVANLLLARSARREREIGVRMALGANRSKLIAQLLVESSLLAVLGGVLGLGVAYLGLNALLTVVPADAPNSENIRLDTTVVMYTMGLALLTGFLFGMLPALQTSRVDVQSTLKHAGRGSAGSSRHRMLKSLVVSEVALAIVLLACGGLMVRSYQGLIEVDPGFKTENLLTFSLRLSDDRYPEDSHQVEFFRKVTERLETVPGIDSVGATQTIPLGGSNSWTSISIEGREVEPGDRVSVGYLRITPDYFRTLKIGLLQGRFFNASDQMESPRVVIVNETMARLHWPGEESVLGQRFKRGAADSENPWMTIAGIVSDVKHQSLGRDARPEMYIPHGQTAGTQMILIARTGGNPTAMIKAAQSAVWEIDPELPVARVRTMEQVVERQTDAQKVSAQILGIVALVALLLAAVGIYGVISYAVTERTQEIGVRTALGAAHRDILTLVAKQALTLVGLGLAVGLAAAFGSLQVLSGLLYGVTPTDPSTYFLTAALLVGVALLASYLPARRACRVDPVIALRCE